MLKQIIVLISLNKLRIIVKKSIYYLVLINIRQMWIKASANYTKKF